MATVNDRTDYDTSIGTEERSARSATKLWAIVLGIVLLIGISLIVTFYNSRVTTDGQPGGASQTSQSPGP